MKQLSDRLTPQWRHRFFIAYLVVMILVFLTPTPDTGVEFRHVDKVVHLGLFVGFALLFYLDRGTSPWRTFLTSTGFAAGIELVQGILPFRELEWGDFVAGAGGAALVSLILMVAEERKRVSNPR